MLDNPEIKKVAIIGRKRSQIIPYQIIFASENIPFYAAEDLHVFLSDAFNELKELLAIKARSEATGPFAPDPVADLIKLCDKVKRYPLNNKERKELSRYLYTQRPQSLLDAIGALYLYRGPLKGCDENSRILENFCDAIKSLLEAKTVDKAIDSISQSFQGLQKDYGKAMDDIFYTDPPFLYLSEYAKRYGSDYRAFYQDIEKAIATLARILPDEENESGELDESWKLPLHLMTALRAKGKEYDAVIILDANQGIWPSKLAETENDLEQERRVFYVAFTRARKRLYLLVNDSILGEPALPTPYIQEMGLKILDEYELPLGQID